jgi:hypothetical protein
VAKRRRASDETVKAVAREYMQVLNAWETISGTRQLEFEKMMSEVLEEYRVDLESGNKGMILDTMSFCFRHDIQLPEWVIAAFVKALREAHEELSWEAVFGRLVPQANKREKHKAAQQRDARLLAPVFLKIRERKALNKPTTDFAAIADEIRRDFKIPGATASVVSRIYYRMTCEDRVTLEASLRFFQMAKREAIQNGRDPEAELAEYFAKYPQTKISKERCRLLFSQKIDDF